jgi:RHS repeat-associated protein
MGNKQRVGSSLSISLLLGLSISTGQAEGIRFYHGDHLGSSTVVTDEQGEAVEAIQYTPFGESFFPSPNPLPFGERATGEGTIYQFTSQELNPESDLYDYGARCYDPVLSRFLSVDPIRDETNPQDLNLYAYAWNNPLRVTDPTGKDEKKETMDRPVALLELWERPDLVSQEERDFVLTFLKDMAEHYNIRYWDGDKDYNLEEVDKIIQPLRSEPTESTWIAFYQIFELPPIPPSQYHSWVKNAFRYLIWSWKERDKLKKIHEEFDRVRGGMPKEKVFEIMTEPPRSVRVASDFDFPSIDLTFPGYFSDFPHPTIVFRIEAEQVDTKICCYE